MRNIIVFVAFLAAGACDSRAADLVTTGWLSDEACAMARAKHGTYTVTNPGCAMECIRKGKRMVLIAENDKAVYIIDNPDKMQDHFAEHLEITGTLDRSSNLLHVNGIKD